MKKLLYSIALVIAVGITLTSCKSDTKSDAKELVEDVKQEMKSTGEKIKETGSDALEATKEAGQDALDVTKKAGDAVVDEANKIADNVKEGVDKALATYQCPMKCEGDKVYHKEEQCPVCKMDLKEVE